MKSIVLILLVKCYFNTFPQSHSSIRLDFMPDLQAVHGASLLHWHRGDGGRGKRILEGDTCGKEKGLIARDQLV